MCGICGFFDKKRELGEETLHRMNEAQGHRGPDDSGLFFQEGVGLGHRRLSVIDLSANGHQPMFNEDQNLAVVFNGTIFNFPELREELLKKGHRFLSRSDTEILLHLYEEKKEGMLRDIQGQFAFALWDSRERRMLLARDRLGIKPLYYAIRNGTFLFASEIKALLASGAVPRELDAGGLVSFLESNSVAPPGTIFRDISVLPAGHYLLHDGNGIDLKSYWDMEFSSHKEGLSYQAYKEKLREALFKSVESMLVGDVPVGVFLSGGIDSSAIAGILGKLGRGDIETFSIGFSDGAYNELPYARKVAERNLSRHHEILLTPQDLLEGLPHIIRAMDQPTGDGPNTYLIAQRTRQHVTVALSGLGGDELFFGYHLFPMIPKVLALTAPLYRLPDGLRSGARSLGRILCRIAGRNERFADVLQGFDPFAAAYLAMRRVFPEDLISKTLMGTLPPRFPFRELVEECLGSRRGLATGEAISRLELKTYMQNTLLRDADVMAMAHALEVRFPLLDEGLLDLAGEIPPAFKEGKRIFIDAVRDLLPPEIINRKKMGFSFPIPLWMKGALKPIIMERLSPEGLQRSGIFRPRVVGRLLDDFYHGKGADFRLVWSLFILDLWHEVHVEGKELELKRNVR